MRSAWVEVDLGAIEQNVRGVARLVGQNCAVMAVVKANAYGHGLVETALAALRGGAKWLCVALPAEGVRLREEGVEAPILVLGGALPEEAADLAAYRLSAAVYSARQVRASAAAAAKLGLEAGVQIKVDTGMGRLGVTPAELPALAQTCQGTDGARLEGVWSHLATADCEDDLYAQAQFRQFRAALRAVRWTGPKRLAHLCNSAAILQFPAMHLSGVRPGLLIYGLRCTPVEEVKVNYRPALSLKAKVVMVKRRPAGCPLSYGCTYVTERSTRLATVPLGYADGYSRALSNRGQVLIKGKRAPIVGRVCMDQFLVDVTHIAAVREGDEVVLIGQQGRQRIDGCEVATWAGTIVNETVSALGERLPRVYVRKE